MSRSNPRTTRSAVLMCAGLLALAGCGATSTATDTTPSSSAPASVPAATVSGAESAGVARSAAESQTGVAYASASPSQTLDLYLPASDGRTAVPVVVLIHGGAFAMGDSGMEAGLAQALVQEGFAVAAVNYRLSGEALYPSGAQDVKAAVRWLRANAGEYGLDTSKVAAWGQSAGGWMATMLGVTGDQATIFDDDSLGNANQSDAVQAVVSWYGPVDFATMDEQAAASACAGQAQSHGTADSPESQWLGEAVSTSGQTESTDLTSYLETASQIPAFSLAHGDADCNVPPGQSQQLKDALDQIDAESTLTILPGASHADPAFDQTQTASTIAFLKQALGA